MRYKNNRKEIFFNSLVNPPDPNSDLLSAKAEYNKLIDIESKSSKRYLSEDYKFCYDAAKAGLKVWLCPWMRTQHAGTYVFGGSLLDLANLGASATADVGQLNKIKENMKKRRAQV